MRAIQTLAYICLLMGFLILLHQYMVYGAWFQIRDVHHETFSVAFFSLGLGILLGLVGSRAKLNLKPLIVEEASISSSLFSLQFYSFCRLREIQELFYEIWIWKNL